MQHSLPYDHYYRYEEIAGILRGYAQQHPELTRLTVIGTTPQGRDILALEVTDKSTGAFEDKNVGTGKAVTVDAGDVVWNETSQ